MKVALMKNVWNQRLHFVSLTRLTEATGPEKALNDVEVHLHNDFGTERDADLVA